MNPKRVLIVDDEESILRVLRNSLKKVDPSLEVTTVTNGFAALDQLLIRPYDVVVTDFNMAEMDGLELAEAIRYAQPDARLIMITAYGNDVIEAEARRIRVFRYLTKPLEINTFRQIVQDALQGQNQEQANVAAWSEQSFRQMHDLLNQLRIDVSARCGLLTDTSANIIAKSGNTDGLPLESMVSLLSGSIVTLIEAGRTVDGNSESIHLAYREGKNDDLYALNVGQQFLLILVINRGPYSSRLGSVWYHARQASLNLKDKLDKIETAAKKPLFNVEINQAFDIELDKLLV